MWLPEPINVDSYYEDSVSNSQTFPKFEGTASCDLCIIGGGITGVSAALHAAEAGLSVVLLEGKNIAWGASGRNAGFMTPYVDYDPLAMVKALGEVRARSYWSLAHEAVEYLDVLIEKHAISCDLKHGVLMAAHSERSLKGLEESTKLFARDFGLQGARIVRGSEVAGVVNTKRYVGGLLHDRIATLHPLKYVQALAERARAAGAKLYIDSEVTKFVDLDDSISVTTKNGSTIKCKNLLLAANAYCGGLVPELSSRFLAMHANMIGTEQLPPKLLLNLFPKDVGVLEVEAATSRFYRISQDGRLIFGGGGPLLGRNGKHVKLLLQKQMGELFPELRNASVPYVWGGWFGMTAYGDTPDWGRLAPRVYYAQAIPVVWATLHGRLLTESITKSSPGYDLLADIDLPRGPGGQALSKLIWTVGDMVAATRAWLS